MTEHPRQVRLRRLARKQTVQGRRRRLREALIEGLTATGWTHLGRNTFGRTNPARGLAPRSHGEPR